MTKTMNSMPTTEEVKEHAIDLGGQFNEKAHGLGDQVARQAEGLADKLPELHRPDGWAVNVSQPERIISVAGGLALVAVGLMHRTPVGMAFGLAGSALLVRGLTGHSVVYQGLGIYPGNSSNVLPANVPSGQATTAG
jgi:hypothetical protein